MAGDSNVQQQSTVMTMSPDQGYSSAASATDDVCRTGPTYTRVRWFSRPTWPYRQVATCFASAQPKAQVSGGVDCLCLYLCLPSKSKSKSQIATTLANFLAPASDCTENRSCWLCKLCSH